MDALHLILYILHMIAMLAIIVGPAAAGRGHLIQVWGARIQLLLGLGLTGLAEAGDDPVNHAKIGVNQNTWPGVANGIQVLEHRQSTRV